MPTEEAHVRKRTLAHYASSRENNFDVLRLFAAALVLFSHSFALVGLNEPKLGVASIGVVGVEIFFAISGFLIIKSWLSQPQLRAFLVKRSLRILPALFVTVAASAYVLGSLVTDRSLSDYLLSAEPVRYVADSLVAVMSAGTLGHIPYELPGVFADNPHSAVNGSLWTLPVEVRAYYLIALLGVLGLLVRWLSAVTFAGALVVLTLSLGGDWPAVGSAVDRFAAETESLMLIGVFLAAALLYLKRERIPMSAPLAATAFVAWLALSWTDLGAVAAIVTVPYFVLFAAYRSSASLRRLTRHGDVSYGLYLLAFPVQQSVVLVTGAGIGAWGLAAISLPLTYVLSVLSWRVVESPALRLKAVFTQGRAARRIEETQKQEPAPAPV